MKHRSVRLTFLFGLLCPHILFTPAACSPDNGFRCGEFMPSDGVTVQSCEGEYEMCVCLTRSCAKLDVAGPQAVGGLGGALAALGECDSGYRYADRPFADSTWAGKCVPESHLGYDVIKKDEPANTTCEDVRPTRLTRYEDPNASGGDGGTSSAGSDENSSGGSDPVSMGGVGGESIAQ